MTPEEELLAKPNWYDGRQRAWSPQDLKEAYDLYNRLTGQNKRDQGCGSCRRAVIQALQQKYQEAIRLQNNSAPDQASKL